jgi:hypothetical protein
MAVAVIAGTSGGCRCKNAGAEMSDDDLPLHERFTLFFDFLGSSKATSWPKERLYPFLDLLITIAAHMQSAQDIDGSPQQNGSYRILITPEVTVFSDNIVVSYPSLGDETSVPTEIPRHLSVEAHWAKFMCQDAIRILSGVAEMGLRIGVLIRGGFSFGQLYHENGVVFGEAMVDAYQLESKHAGYPRVLVSERIIKRLTGIPNSDRTFLLQDADGRWHLNYFAEMIRHLSNGPVDDEHANRWKCAHLATIDAAIDAANALGDARIVEKWIWFKARFEKATVHIKCGG